MGKHIKLLPLCLLLLLAACGQNGAQVHAAAPPAAASEAGAPAYYRGNFLEDAAALQAAEAALKALPQFSGKAVNVFENVDFFGGVRPRIELDVQDPNEPEKIEHYIYEHGRWRTDGVLRIPPEGLNIPKHLTPLSQLAFADTAKFADIWSQKARSVDAVVTEPYFVSWVLLEKERKRFWHTATIEAVGAQYYLSFHADGTVWEFKKLGGKKQAE